MLRTIGSALRTLVYYRSVFFLLRRIKIVIELQSIDQFQLALEVQTYDLRLFAS